ncbi:hypothetical protein M5K25_028259 [Dendrobium thyrsiflorum]
MLVREVGELLRSIEIPHLYPNENRSESLPASACSLCSRHTHAPARMPPWFGTKPSDTYDRRRKRPPCTAGGSQRPVVFQQQAKKSAQGCVAKKEKEQATAKAVAHPFSFRGTQVDWRGGIRMDLGVFVRAVCGESRTYGNEGGSRLYV